MDFSSTIFQFEEMDWNTIKLTKKGKSSFLSRLMQPQSVKNRSQSYGELYKIGWKLLTQLESIWNRFVYIYFKYSACLFYTQLFDRKTIAGRIELS